MARKRNDWGPKGEEIFADMTRRGLTAGEVSAALKAAGISGASPATVQRRQREFLGPRRVSASPVEAPASRPTVLDDVPEDAEELAKASASELDWWLGEVKQAYERAKGGEDEDGHPLPGNPAAMASLAARATALLEAKRKASPPVFVDPNDALDIREAAERARKLFHETLHNIIGNRGLS
jgi:hypothetical protein